jgi:predicted metalloprotease with PDZ domain
MDSLNYLYAKNTFDLYDAPILAGPIKTTSFLQNNRPVFVHSYSKNPLYSAQSFKRTLKRAVKDADHFSPDGTPEPYTFLLNVFTENPEDIGAHEHHCSSVYALYAETPAQLKPLLGMMARHELFHRTVPLSLQSMEIKNNNYLGLHPVSHLWFYEGLAQWATFKMQLINGSLSERRLCAMVRNELYSSDIKKDTVSLITASNAVLENHGLLEQFYRRGFLFCTLLDLYIIQKTNGRVTLRDILLSMAKTYPPGRPFDSDSLFSLIAAQSTPDVYEFCENHLYRNDPLPIRELFQNIGIRYIEKERSSRMLADFGVLSYRDMKNRRMVIAGIYNDGPVTGFQPGDTILSIDGADFYLSFACGPIISRLFFTAPGTGYTAVVNRKGKEHTIRGRTVPFYNRHVFYFDNEYGTHALTLRKVWASR